MPSGLVLLPLLGQRRELVGQVVRAGGEVGVVLILPLRHEEGVVAAVGAVRVTATHRPYINLSAFDEDLSTGVSIDQRRVIAGGRFDFATDGAMQPFVRAAVDYKKTTNSSTGSDSYTHPLLGLGLNGTLGGGQLSSEIGYSRYNSTTRDLSLQFRYEMNF